MTHWFTGHPSVRELHCSAVQRSATATRFFLPVSMCAHSTLLLAPGSALSAEYPCNFVNCYLTFLMCTEIVHTFFQVPAQLIPSEQKVYCTCRQPRGCEPLPGLCSPHSPAPPPSSPSIPTQITSPLQMHSREKPYKCVVLHNQINKLGQLIWGHIWERTAEKS